MNGKVDFLTATNPYAKRRTGPLDDWDDPDRAFPDQDDVSAKLLDLFMTHPKLKRPGC